MLSGAFKNLLRRLAVLGARFLDDWRSHSTTSIQKLLDDDGTFD